MKIKTDFGDEIEVPKKIEQHFLNEIEIDESKKLSYEWGSSHYECIESCFRDWMNESYYEYMAEYSDKLCDVDIADFLISWKIGISIYGGYDKIWGMSFEDNGYRYNVSTFGWTGELEEDPKNTNFGTLVSKEKIKVK